MPRWFDVHPLDQKVDNITDHLLHSSSVYTTTPYIEATLGSITHALLKYVWNGSISIVGYEPVTVLAFNSLC